MATKNASITQYHEVIPSSDLPLFKEALDFMDKLEVDLEPIDREARALKIVSKSTRERAGILNAQIKQIEGTAEDTMAPYDKILKRVKDFIQTRKLRVKNRKTEISGILAQKMADWDRAEEAAAVAERDRVARETQQRLEREAQEKRRGDELAAVELRRQKVAEIRQDLKDKKITKRQAEKLLREAGAMEEALKAQASAEEDEARQNAAHVASRVEVKPDATRVPGNVRRVNYSAECSDPNQFIQALLSAHARRDMKTFTRLHEMIEVSDTKLSREARELIKTSPQDVKHDLTVEEFEALYPFVKVKEERTF